MHQHHKLALDKARANFRKAQIRLNVVTKRHNSLREYMLVRDMTGRYHRSVLRAAMAEVLEAIEDYQATGEILVIVERLLERA